MLIQKQFGCLKFLSVNFNDTQVCKGETSKKTTLHNLNSPPDKRHPVQLDTENTDHGPDMCFYRPLVNQSE